jgi:hypothetical protein
VAPDGKQPVTCTPDRVAPWPVHRCTGCGGGTEVSGNGYTREAVTFTVSGNNASNDAAIEFPTATGSWGTITHAAVFDASTSGNMIAYASLTASKVIDTGDVLRVPTGDLDINLD